MEALSVVIESRWPCHIRGWRWGLRHNARDKAGFKPAPTARHGGAVRCHRITMVLGGPHQGMEMAAAFHGKGQGGFQTRAYGTTRWHCPLSQNHYGLGRATSGDGDGCCVPRQGPGRVSNPAYGTTRWHCSLSQNHYGLGRATSGDGDGCCVPRQGPGRVSNPGLRHDTVALDVFIE